MSISRLDRHLVSQLIHRVLELLRKLQILVVVLQSKRRIALEEVTRPGLAAPQNPAPLVIEAVKRRRIARGHFGVGAVQFLGSARKRRTTQHVAFLMAA